MEEHKQAAFRWTGIINDQLNGKGLGIQTEGTQ